MICAAICESWPAGGDFLMVEAFSFSFARKQSCLSDTVDQTVGLGRGGGALTTKSAERETVAPALRTQCILPLTVTNLQNSFPLRCNGTA
jgi:hypothetical protein